MLDLRRPLEANTAAAGDSRLVTHVDAIGHTAPPLQVEPDLHRPRRTAARALVASDAFALVAAVLVTAVAVGDAEASKTVAVMLAWLPFLLLLARAHRLYAADETAVIHSTLDDLVPTAQFVTLGTWGLFLVIQAFDLLPSGASAAIAFWAGAMVFVPLSRATTRMLVHRYERHAERVVIVGAGKVALGIAERLASRHRGVEVVGFLDRNPLLERSGDGGPPLLGSPDELPDVVRSLRVDRVIVAFSTDSHSEMLQTIRSVSDMNVRVDIIPRLFEVIGGSARLHSLDGIPLLGMPAYRLSRADRAAKRALDIALSATALVLLAPLLLVVAAAIRLDSKGPALFRQVRRGEAGATFRIYKFRTMVTDAEARRAELAHLNIHRDTDPRMFKVVDDPRITRVGAFLRRTSIDELPQIINVLRGEMSIVGPRPLILEEDQHVRAWQRKRLSLKPGITGLWQVLGRSDIPFEEMVKLDYLYVANWSVAQDVRLIGLTLPALLRKRRAL